MSRVVTARGQVVDMEILKGDPGRIVRSTRPEIRSSRPPDGSQTGGTQVMGSSTRSVIDPFQRATEKAVKPDGNASEKRLTGDEKAKKARESHKTRKRDVSEDEKTLGELLKEG